MTACALRNALPAGPQTADGAPPANAPAPEGLWAYAAAALRRETNAWRRDPHPELIAAS